MKKILMIVSLLSSLAPVSVFAGIPDKGIEKVEVIEILKESREKLPGLDEIQTTIQSVRSKFLTGENKGEELFFMNDYIPLKSGDTAFVSPVEQEDGRYQYRMFEIGRSHALWWLLAIFVVCILVFAGKQGVRSLLSLAASLCALFFVLNPLLLRGYDPIISSFVVASLVLAFAIFVTHKFNWGSLVAYMGTMIAVIITGVLTWFVLHNAHMTGITGEEATYLNYLTGGKIDLKGLLFGGILIGILGVLDDIAITQVAVIQELLHAHPTMEAKKLYQSALRVGREHMAALVNTLVLAYVGASLPLVLVFSAGNTPLEVILNQELIVTEIARSLLGSVGLILAIPITTALAVYYRERIMKGKHLHSHSHSHNH